ncbi:MAG: hypothetical protein KA015_02180 [Spirochaetes bacterium]|nr:hypothetical protein [Spirochaetota bacterium]
MSLLRNIGWNIRITLIAGGAAFLISLLSGLVSGNPFAVVLLRAVLFASVFAGLSFGSLFVLKKFVPEFFDTLFSVLPEIKQEDDSLSDESAEHSPLSETGEYGAETEASQSGETFDAPPSFAPTGLDQISASSSSLNPGKKKLEEQALKFQPKIMAEAVRTMMNKDNE